MKARGLAHTTLLYETIRDNSPKDSARVLFDQINQTIEKRSGIKILPTETTTENWDRLDEKWCNPNQPYIYELPQIDIRLHRDVRTKTNWEFQEQTSDQLAMIISSGELKRLEDSGLYQIYEEFRREAERNPGLQTKMLNSYKNVKEIFAKKSLK